MTTSHQVHKIAPMNIKLKEIKYIKILSFTDLKKKLSYCPRTVSVRYFLFDI